ncbi:hypothetical protein MSG28_013821 [Choristoneura fumiferana]|uniref:Uncharacterized protein n=1 Tax=Choristoneura fumiferana TaxID=7141 RepID=A0ACC0K8T3_CHOFU|nr:hypothetical protein MSG28_013821 [Choristoneura fumiferana]
MPEVHPAHILAEHYQQRGSMEAMPPNSDKARDRATEMEVKCPKIRGLYSQGRVYVEAAWEQTAGPAGAHVAAHRGRRAAGGRAELGGRGATGAGQVWMATFHEGPLYHWGTIGQQQQSRMGRICMEHDFTDNQFRN